ncbi:TPA: hypothetical protein ACLGWU_000941 [Salmonella enterica]
MSLNSWLLKIKPTPPWLRQFMRLSLQMVVWGAGLTVVCAVLIFVVLQDPQSMNVTLWLDNARFPLLVWRLMLYAILAGTWFGGIRKSLMAQIHRRGDSSSLSSLRRLEIMAIALIALSEYNVWLAPR